MFIEERPSHYNINIMFEDEEFDLDEDFLNDLTQKESQYYSQSQDIDEENSSKRFKNDEDSSDSPCDKFISNTVDKLQDKANSTVEPSVPNFHESGVIKTLRTNLILERLKQQGKSTSDAGIRPNTSLTNCTKLNQEESSLAQKSCSHPVSIESRRNLILNRLQQKSDENVPISTCSPKDKSVPNNHHGITLSDSASNRYETREDARLKPAKALCTKPIPLVRQFPGPAGLLRGTDNGSIPQIISESSHLKDGHDDTDIDIVDNNAGLSKYCSQQTANLFFEGAWQSLMSDLDHGFLKEHEISTVKQKCLANSYKNNKAPFLAGIVQRVDFSCLDPVVVLKDCTGTIEGTISKEILVKYPQYFVTGAVFFLGNVGLTTIGSYLKKCHFIATLKNIINIYSGNAKIFSKLEMSTKLDSYDLSHYFCEPGSNDSITDELQERYYIERLKPTNDMNGQINLSSLKNDHKLNETTNFTRHAPNNVTRTTAAEKFAAALSKKLDFETTKIPENKLTNLITENRENFNDVNCSEVVDHKNGKFSFEFEDLEGFDEDFNA